MRVYVCVSVLFGRGGEMRDQLKERLLRKLWLGRPFTISNRQPASIRYEPRTADGGLRTEV